MSDLTTYRIDWGKAHDSTHNNDGTLTGKYTLVPDTRLQAIADAWNKANNRWPGVFYQDLALEAPKLVALLDALGGTDNER